MIKFKLNTEMTDKEIIQELKAKTSGESKQELEQFFAPINNDVQFKIPSHNVVLGDDTYAVIAKALQNKTPFGHFTLNYEYWLVGTNDEGKYFCHPFTGYSGKPHIEAILEWINRSDEGFTKRIQGDVLIQFATMNKISEREFEVRTRQRSFYVAFFQEKERNLNNHKLTTDGQISTDGEYTFVSGTQLVLQHPQHGMVTELIPKDHIAILTNQRGRFRNGGFD